MKRFAVVPLLVLAAALPGLQQPTAAQTTGTPTDTAVPAVPYNGYCLTQPYNTVQECTPVPTPTRGLIEPNKSLAVSAGTPGPAGTTMYTVGITSQLACFSLDEPVHIYALSGDPDAAALTAIQPEYPSNGSQVSILPDPATGSATLKLEVVSSLVGPGGLDVKATWPIEGIERFVNVIPPIEPTATATSVAAPPEGGRGPVLTDTPVPDLTGTATAEAATQPSATATATPAFTLRACVDPRPVSVGSGATLYAQTTPGAVCTASVTAPETVSNFDGTAQTALSDGFVVFPFTAGLTPGLGTARVSCTYAGQTLVTTTTFKIVIPGTTTPPPPAAPPSCVTAFASGSTDCNATHSYTTSAAVCPPGPIQGHAGLSVITCVTPNPLPFNALAMVYARTVPGAFCVPVVVYSDGSSPASLAGGEYADFTGLAQFTFVESTLAYAGTATVTCTVGTETAQDTVNFAINP